LFVVLVYPLKPLASWVKDAVLLPLLAVHLLLSAVLQHQRLAVLLLRRLVVHQLPKLAVLQLLSLAAIPVTHAAVTANCSKDLS
jgi:hypothetical protein